MEVEDIQQLVEGKVKNAIQANNAELLNSIGDMIAKISAPPSNSSTQSGFDAPKFKRKSNEEQYKQNHKVMVKLQEAEDSIDKNNLAVAKQSIIEAKNLLKYRQKLVQLADTSELGWRTVAEYETNPIASDSDDERRIYKAEARASRKAKTERARKRPARETPYARPRSRSETQASMQVPAVSQQRPGLCFLCGKPGHWKNECLRRDRVSNNKISTVSCSVELGAGEVIQTIPLNKSVRVIVPAEGKSVLSPVGRLKRHIGRWKEVTDSKYILDVVENGYRLPLTDEPAEVRLKNNKSARDNPEFVKSEINSLITKGVVSEVDSAPRVVNPLTVAYGKSGKPRLVLDCRHVNPLLHLFKVKFEDIKIAMEMFDLSSYIFTFDLKSAYHHIDIFPEHRTFLGFCWNDDSAEGGVKFYVFNSLPFGLATAGHIFTKTLRCAVKHWRAHGHRVIMFLDDGIGGKAGYADAERSSVYVKETLIELGFLLAHDKCNWSPAKIAHWLGHKLDFYLNRLFITEERIIRLILALDSLLSQIHSESAQVAVPVRFLASVTGQIISLQSVLGKIVCRKTRYLHKCIDSRVGWNCIVNVDFSAVSELLFWRENVRVLNSRGRDIRPRYDTEMCVFTDASVTGYGGYVALTKAGVWSEKQVVSPCTEKCLADTGVTQLFSELAGSNDLVGRPQLSDVSLSMQSSGVAQSAEFCKVGFSSPELPDESTFMTELHDVSTGLLELQQVSSGLSELPEESVCLSELPEVSSGLSELPEVSSGVIALPEASAGLSKLHDDSLFSTKLPEVSSGLSESMEISSDQYESVVCSKMLSGVDLRDTLKRKFDEAGAEIHDRDTVVLRMATHLLASRAESTVNKYAYQVQAFKDFFSLKGFQYSPAAPIHVAMYLSSMIDSGKSDSVITSAFYGIKWFHNINDLSDPTENSLVKSMLESAKRLNSRPIVKKDVISSELLIRLCDMYIGSVDVIDLRDLSMIVLCYAGFLRFSEVSALRRSDVEFKSDHLILYIQKSKTDVYRSGKHVFIAKGSTSACPYAMLRAYLSCAELDSASDKYLFQPACRSGSKCFLLDKDKKLSYTRARECMMQKLRLVAPNLRLGTHSLRASGATAAANSAGVSDRCLKRHGRWRSDSAKDGYIEDSVDKKLFITKQLKL